MCTPLPVNLGFNQKNAAEMMLCQFYYNEHVFHVLIIRKDIEMQTGAPGITGLIWDLNELIYIMGLAWFLLHAW